MLATCNQNQEPAEDFGFVQYMSQSDVLSEKEGHRVHYI